VARAWRFPEAPDRPPEAAAAPCLELHRPQRLQQDPPRRGERPDPGSLGGPGEGGDGRRLHPGEPDPPSGYSPPLRGLREGGGVGYPANPGRWGAGPTPDRRRSEPWAPDPWCGRGSSYTERRGVRRHHEGEAGRGQQRRHSRFQPGTEQLRCIVGRCRPAQATQGRRDPGLGARREAPEDL